MTSIESARGSRLVFLFAVAGTRCYSYLMYKHVANPCVNMVVSVCRSAHQVWND